MPTLIAELKLRPGRYEFHQRVDQGERLLHVVEAKPDASYSTRGRGRKRLVVDVKSRLEPSGERASETAIYLRLEDRVARVEWIVLAGEEGRYFPEGVRR